MLVKNEKKQKRVKDVIKEEQERNKKRRRSITKRTKSIRT